MLSFRNLAVLPSFRGPSNTSQQVVGASRASIPVFRRALQNDTRRHTLGVAIAFFGE
jgi:hypothetical protein